MHCFAAIARSIREKIWILQGPHLTDILVSSTFLSSGEHVVTLTTGGKQFYHHTVTLSDDGKPYGTCRLPQK